MAITRLTNNLLVNTAEDFQKAITDFHAAMLSVGLVQTADTGQLDPASVALPATNGIASGYLMYRFNDTLQATKPIFIKMQFGRNNTANGSIVWYLTVGTGTNGSGTITGINFANTYTSASGDATANGYSAVCGDAGAGGTGWVTFIWHAGGVATNLISGFSISRTRTSTGVATGDGANVSSVTIGRYANKFLNFINSNTYPSTGNTLILPSVIVPTVTSLAYNGLVGVMPVQPARPYLDYPDLGMVLYMNNDIAAGAVFKTRISGAYRKYVALGYMTTIYPNSSGTQYRVGIRIE